MTVNDMMEWKVKVRHVATDINNYLRGEQRVYYDTVDDLLIAAESIISDADSVVSSLCDKIDIIDHINNF